MNKLFAVLKREYIQAVRKKMFIVMTFLLPFLMAALFLLPAFIMGRGLGEKHVAVVDGTGKLARAYEKPNEVSAEAAKKQATDTLSGDRRASIPSSLNVTYVDASKGNLDADAKPYLSRVTAEKSDQGLDAVMVVPANAFGADDARLRLYSRSAADLMTQERLTSMTNHAIQRQRLESRGVGVTDVDNVLRNLPVEATQLSKNGEEKKGGESNFIVVFVFAALLILPSYVYGLEIMRGIIQEKSERVVEVLVSSMTPVQLLTGKILGVAAVGLTQIFVWAVMGSLAAAYYGGAAAMAGLNVMQFLRFSTFVYFLIFFVLAYLTYVCIYAITGAICNSDKEAQQLIGPISMVILLPWFLMLAIIMNPDSLLAVGLSFSPVFGPITMFARAITSEPPIWHFLVSIGVSAVTIVVLFWATAKIFRIGILSYGKRPTIPEIWRWMKVA